MGSTISPHSKYLLTVLLLISSMSACDKKIAPPANQSESVKTDNIKTENIKTEVNTVAPFGTPALLATVAKPSTSNSVQQVKNPIKQSSPSTNITVIIADELTSVKTPPSSPQEQINSQHADGHKQKLIIPCKKQQSPPIYDQSKIEVMLTKSGKLSNTMTTQEKQDVIHQYILAKQKHASNCIRTKGVR